MRCVVWTGSRGWEDISAIVYAVESLPQPFRSFVGDARGFDALVWHVLESRGLPRWRFKAKWNQQGRSAGPKRSERMLGALMRFDPKGFLVAGWDGTSTGTKGCMDRAEKLGIPVWKIN